LYSESHNAISMEDIIEQANWLTILKNRLKGGFYFL
jgi:hypothetical protein